MQDEDLFFEPPPLPHMMNSEEEAHVCWVIEFQRAPMHHVSEAVLRKLSSQLEPRHGRMVSKTQARSGMLGTYSSTFVYVSGPRTLFENTTDQMGILMATQAERDKLHAALYDRDNNAYVLNMTSDPKKPACPGPNPAIACYEPFVEIAPSSSCLLL
jgi:hypothetical protein